MAQDSRKLASIERVAERSASGAPPRSGWIAAIEPDGTILVDWEGNEAGPLAARTLVEMPPEAVAGNREAFLMFDGGDPAQPVVVGLLCPKRPAGTAAVVRRRVLEVEEELVLCCGDASITLRRDEVIIRAPYVETHAAGANKVRGGCVQVN